MPDDERRPIVVTGATGLQGGAVVRHLLSDGWHVRALTRNAKSHKARGLAALGAEVVEGDMANSASLVPLFQGAVGVFSVQNPMISGIAEEIKQGRNVADAARQTGIRHLVYSSAGTGSRDTGVPSWESKRVIEDHIKALDLPSTIVRPVAFMELMTEKKFFPLLTTWHLMPQLMGSTRKMGWICVDDLGAVVAKAFAEPNRFIGQEIQLTSDVQSIDQCRATYQDVMGKQPPHFPLPAWLFQRFGFVGKDLSLMWRWLHTAKIDWDTSATLEIHPQAFTVRAWLGRSA